MPCKKKSEISFMWHHWHKNMCIAEMTLEKLHEPYWFLYLCLNKSDENPARC